MKLKKYTKNKNINFFIKKIIDFKDCLFFKIKKINPHKVIFIGTIVFLFILFFGVWQYTFLSAHGFIKIFPQTVEGDFENIGEVLFLKNNENASIRSFGRSNSTFPFVFMKDNIYSFEITEHRRIERSEEKKVEDLEYFDETSKEENEILPTTTTIEKKATTTTSTTTTTLEKIEEALVEEVDGEIKEEFLIEEDLFSEEAKIEEENKEEEEKVSIFRQLKLANLFRDSFLNAFKGNSLVNLVANVAQKASQSESIETDITKTMILSNFSVPELLQDELSSQFVGKKQAKKEILNIKLGLSLANEIKVDSESKLIIEAFNKNEWILLEEISLNKNISNALLGSYYYVGLGNINTTEDLEELKIRISYNKKGINLEERFYLDSVWVEVAVNSFVENIIGANVREIANDLFVEFEKFYNFNEIISLRVSKEQIIMVDVFKEDYTVRENIIETSGSDIQPTQTIVKDEIEDQEEKESLSEGLDIEEGLSEEKKEKIDSIGKKEQVNDKQSKDEESDEQQEEKENALIEKNTEKDLPAEEPATQEESPAKEIGEPAVPESPEVSESSTNEGAVVEESIGEGTALNIFRRIISNLRKISQRMIASVRVLFVESGEEKGVQEDEEPAIVETTTTVAETTTTTIVATTTTLSEKTEEEVEEAEKENDLIEEQTDKLAEEGKNEESGQEDVLTKKEEIDEKEDQVADKDPKAKEVLEEKDEEKKKASPQKGIDLTSRFEKQESASPELIARREVKPLLDFKIRGAILFSHDRKTFRNNIKIFENKDEYFISIEQGPDLMPGEYTLVIKYQNKNDLYFDKIEFTWGGEIIKQEKIDEKNEYFVLKELSPSKEEEEESSFNLNLYLKTKIDENKYSISKINGEIALKNETTGFFENILFFFDSEEVLNGYNMSTGASFSQSFDRVKLNTFSLNGQKYIITEVDNNIIFNKYDD